MRESFDITILNPDGKTFQLVLAYKNRWNQQMKVWTSPEISTHIADWQLVKIINGKFYAPIHNNHWAVEVVKKMYNANGDRVHHHTLAVKSVFTVT